MDKKLLVALLAGATLAIITSANANKAAGTVEQCAAILPEGYVFEMDIIGTIDTTGEEPNFTGRMGLTENSQQSNPELGQAIQPFIECVQSLLE